jgi:hypothetical protein
MLAAFPVIEQRSAAPLLPLRLFRLKTLAGSNAVGFLLGASFYSFIFIGTLYMHQVLGYSAMKTGLAWLATSVASWSSRCGATGFCAVTRFGDHGLLGRFGLPRTLPRD